MTKRKLSVTDFQRELIKLLLQFDPRKPILPRVRRVVRPKRRRAI